jgi:CRISPR-associated endoribonuclease Cas6
MKSWLGQYRKTTQDLLEFAYDAGLGAKNSQGFGLFDIIKDEK